MIERESLILGIRNLKSKLEFFFFYIKFLKVKRKGFDENEFGGRGGRVFLFVVYRDISVVVLKFILVVWFKLFLGGSGVRFEDYFKE